MPGKQSRCVAGGRSAGGQPSCLTYLARKCDEDKTMTDQARHLSDAIHAIDAAFGPGYARDNPALVASLVRARPSRPRSRPAMARIRRR